MEKELLIIRRAIGSDIECIARLFYETIRNVNIQDYSQEEVDDWASWYDDYKKWNQRISDQFFIVAVYGSLIVGFASISTDGYLDFMFVHKDYQKQGIATKLLKVLENKAIEQENPFIYSEVSITAKPFFSSHGYKVEKQQLKKSREKYLINFIMKKHI